MHKFCTWYMATDLLFFFTLIILWIFLFSLFLRGSTPTNVHTPFAPNNFGHKFLLKVSNKRLFWFLGSNMNDSKASDAKTKGNFMPPRHSLHKCLIRAKDLRREVVGICNPYPSHRKRYRATTLEWHPKAWISPRIFVSEELLEQAGGSMAE